ncbi:ABC transporter permease [Chitinophaga lutea]
MLHTFRVAWRHLRKERLFTALNLVGLSTGLACALLIVLWVKDEWQVDRFNVNDDRLFQVMKNTETPKGAETTENTPGPLATALLEQIPEVQYAVQVVPPGSFDKKGVVSAGDKNIEASQQFVGRDFFSVFSYPFVGGAPPADKQSVVLTDALAEKVFGTTSNVVGKSIRWRQKDYEGDYLVSGIIRRPPLNATAQFDILLPYDLFLEKNPKLADWRNSDPATYVVLKPGADLQQFNRKIAGLIKANNEKSTQTLFAQRYSDKYLHNNYVNGAPAGGRIAYLRLFSIIALFILIIACINFMNLSTAKAAGKMKEAGIKKAIGASRRSLIAQYLGESLLLAGLAAGVALLLAWLAFPLFLAITDKQMAFHIDLPIASLMAGITLFTGLLAGSYPALYLSGFKPIQTLKGQLKNSAGEMFIRKGLVVFQFTVTGIFIVAVLVIYRQMQLIQTKQLGYDREHLVYFDKGGLTVYDKADYAPGGKYESDLTDFIAQVKNIPGVVDAANFRHNITNRSGGTTDLSWPGKDPEDKTEFTDLGAGYNFIETLGIDIKAGRSFSMAYGAERSKIIFNELAIEHMGLKDPIGKIVHIWGEDREIIGVAKNFNFQSLHENLKPCFFDLTTNPRASRILVRIEAGQEAATLARLERFYKTVNAGMPFSYKFLDDDYQTLYASEQRVATLSRYFAGMAILISCLGLFGLAALTAQRKQKEIGIRRVVGATTGNILFLLSGSFLKLVLIALAIAFVASWWGLNRWLHDFAYRVQFGAGTYLLAAVIMLAITLLTIGFQSLRAATQNPVKSLRAD